MLAKFVHYRRGSCEQVRITEAPRDYTVVYDDTEESSVTEEEAEQRRSVVSRVKSLERQGARMQGEGGQGEERGARAWTVGLQPRYYQVYHHNSWLIGISGFLYNMLGLKIF